jgi:hypothetical protein
MNIVSTALIRQQVGKNVLKLWNVNDDVCISMRYFETAIVVEFRMQ